MALTPTQEAQVLALVAQQAALLSLAAEEPAIISTLGATDVSLSDLGAASSLGDTDLLLVRQGSTDKSIAGSIVKTAASVPDASEEVKGIVELATIAEAQAGTATDKAVTPAGLASLLPVGTVLPSASNTLKPGFLKTNGAAASRATYPALFADLVKSSVVTMSIASPGVVSWNNHGRSANDVVKFTSTGVLPTGITGGVTYYVVGSSIATNDFQVSTTPGGAAINFTVGQSGIHTAIHAPWGDGDGSTTFNVPLLNGEGLRFWDDGRGVDVNRVFGSAQLDALQGHAHGGAVDSPIGQAYSTGTARYVGSAFSALGSNTSGPVSDGTNGTPRISNETRMRNVALFASIKY